MPSLRAPFGPVPEAPLNFNERTLADRGKMLEALAEEFETHSDFAQARADGEAFDVTVADGLDDLR